jgi:hypothetical protein
LTKTTSTPASACRRCRRAAAQTPDGAARSAGVWNRDVLADRKRQSAPCALHRLHQGQALPVVDIPDEGFLPPAALPEQPSGRLRPLLLELAPQAHILCPQLMDVGLPGASRVVETWAIRCRGQPGQRPASHAAYGGWVPARPPSRRGRTCPCAGGRAGQPALCVGTKAEGDFDASVPGQERDPVNRGERTDARIVGHRQKVGLMRLEALAALAMARIVICAGRLSSARLLLGPSCCRAGLLARWWAKAMAATGLPAACAGAQCGDLAWGPAG